MSKYLDILTNIFKEEADKKASSSSVANISRATKTITTPIINRTVNNPVRNMGYQKAETKAPAVKNLSALSAIPTVKQNATVKYNGLNTQAQRNEQQAQRTGNTNYLNDYTPSSNANTAPVLSERDQRRIANKQEEYAKKVARQENYMISAPTYNAGSVPSSVAQLQKDRFYRNKTDWTGDDEIRILELKKLLETVGVGYNITKGNEAEYKSKVAALRDEYDNLLEIKKRVVGGTDGSFLPDNPYRTELQGIGDNIEAAIVGGFKGLKNLAVGTAAAGARMVDKKYGIDDHTAVNEWQKDNLVDNNAWNEKLAADNVDANSPLGVINAVAQGVGGMLPAIASNAVLPGSGIYVMMSSAAGNSMVEALQNGATEDEAYVYGLASGAVEGLTEKITGGIPGLGAGGLDAVTDKVIGKLAKSAASRYLFKQAANMLGEGFEEWLSEAAGQYLIRIYDEEARNESISDTWVNGQADRLYSALLGSLTSLVMSAPTHSGAAVSEYNSELEYNKYRDEIINSFVKEGLTKKEAAEIADALLQNNVTAPNSPISATFNEATANSPMFNEVAQNGAQSGNTQLPINTNNGIIKTGGSNNELLLNASSQWNVGEGARGQNRELAEGAGRNQSRETQAERRNYFGNLFSNEAVSARSERIGNQEISIAPLSQNIINNTPYVAEVIKAYADKGVTLVPLADSFSFTKKDGTAAYARAVYSNGTIYASVVDPEATLEELSAHEDFHRLVANSRGDIILEMASDLEEQFGEENIRERARQYESAYSGVYDSAGSLDIIEELCADVYAGMNNADLSQIVNKAVEGLEGEANGDTRFSINPNFTKQYDEWDKNPSGGYFNVGTTSQAFQSIGVDPKKIRWYKNKIVEIKNTHLEMTDDIIKKVPEILENPILIMQSVTVPNRVVAVGELTVPINLGDEVVEQPVICAVELRPNGEITNFNFVASAYARGVQSLIDNSDILYIDKNKNRTDEWLSFLRLQLPAEITHYGSIGTVTYYDSKVNNDTSKSKSSMQIALEEAEGLTPAQQQVRDMMFNDYIYPDYNVSNRTDAPEEAIRFKSQYARDLYDTLIKDFGVQKGRRSVNKAIAEYASKYIEGKATQADTDTLFNVLYENGTESEYDNYKAAINDSIKGKKYYAPDHVRKELSYLYDTYKNFKNQSMGKFYLTGNATALRIDVAYQELQNTYGKLYFPDENHEAEMLANILKAYDETTMKPKSLSEVAENEAWEGVSFEESEARYKGILEATLNDFKQKAFKERVSEPSVDTRDILQMYQEVKSLKAAAETAEGAWKLSKTDNIIVDEMLRGAYDNVRKSGIRPDNAEGVQAVYEAKKALRDTQAAIKRHKNAHKAALFDWANNLISNSDAWNEKSAGLGYNTETAERNIRDIIGDNAEAKRVISEVFTPVHENEAEATRMKNDIRKKVKELGLSEKGEYVVMIGERSYKLSEAGLVQAYGEGLISDSRLKATGADFDKITNAVKVFRGIYEQLFEKQNEVLVRNGYPPVEHRVDYFPHFTEDVPETFFKKVLAKMGISIRSDMLPTDIAGLTDTFRPGKAWAGYMQQRKGDVTSYNALKGLDNYIETAGDVLYHMDDIQRVRALESALRYKYSDKGTQEAINEVRANDTLTEEQRQGALDEVYKRDRTAFPNLVTWLRGYGDNLANKKSSDDRGWEHNIGRGIYNTVGAVEKRIAGNMVVGNISSALTNFIPLTQGWAEIKTPNMLYGLYDTIKSYVNNDGLAEESTFLTNRRGSDKLSKTGLEKTSDTLMFLMNGIDDLVSNTLVRSRYYQNVKGGMDSTQAMEEADSWAASVMADRSKGSMPLIFNNKNPLVKLGTMFQLEANNQLRYAFKDIPRGDKGPKQIALALFKMFLGAFLYNELYEKLAGRRPAFDPFGMIKQLIEDWKSDGVGAAGEGLFTNVVEEVPFVGGLVGGGRIPVSSALPDAGNIWRALTDKDGVDTEAIGKELMNPLFYFMFPVGGSQLKKTIQGISTVAQGGEKNAKGGLKFDVEPTVGNYIQAGLFGKWALPEAQEYVDRGFTAMYGKARTEAREEAIEGGMNAETFDGYFNTLTGDTQIDALYALSKLNLSDEEKETLWSATSDWSKSYKEFYEENADIIDSGVSVGKYNELREAFKDLESEDKKYKLYQDATLTGDQKNALGKALEMGDIDFSSYESFILSDYTDKQRYMWDYVSSKGLKLEQYTRALDTYYKDGTPSKAVGIKRLTDAGFTSAWANWFYNNVVNNKEGTGGAETPEKKDYIINQLAQKGYDETYYDKAYEAYKKYGPKEIRIKRIVEAGYSQAWAEWFYAQMQKKVGVNKNGEYYLY